MADLYEWQFNEQEYMNALQGDDIAIDFDRNVLMGMAILLTDKGYLKFYNEEEITSPREVEAIRKAYHAFLHKVNLPIVDTINKKIFKILYSQPSV